MSQIANNLPAAGTSPQEGAGARPTPAPSPTRPTVSVVMIVKNEEEYLGKCLESLQGLGYDQLVIVDTGSTDRSMEIATEHGAELYQHEVIPWDFAKARNISLQYATGDWSLIIDADETLEGGKHIRNMLGRLPDRIGAVSIVMEDMRKEGKETAVTWESVRLVRRSMQPEWRYAYHNKMFHKGELALFDDVKIKHWGYDLDAEAMEAKLARTEEIILRDMEQNGPGPAHRAYFFLAHIASKRNRHEATLRHGRKYVENGRKHPEFNPSIYNVLFFAALSIGEYEEAGHWLDLAREDIPQDLDIAYDLVIYGEWVVRPDLVIEGARTFLTLYEVFEKHRATLGNRFVYHYDPRSLAYVLRKVSAALAGEANGALERYKRVVAALPEEEADVEREQAEIDLQAVGTRWINP